MLRIVHEKTRKARKISVMDLPLTGAIPGILHIPFKVLETNLFQITFGHSVKEKHQAGNNPIGRPSRF
jgi:hypothetical protein